MKKIFIIFLLFSVSSCVVFSPCDGKRYQIKQVEKTKDPYICQYKAVSIGSCLIWNDQKFLIFTDSCKNVQLSEIYDRDYLYNKYANQ